MRLNLGSGDNYHEGWINVDAVVREAPVDLIANVLKLPFSDRSLESIYAGHLLEHMYPREASEALHHWMDLLAYPGKLGIVVPDVQRVAGVRRPGGSIAENYGWNRRMIQECVGGWRDPKDPYALHVSVYSEAQLDWFVTSEIHIWASVDQEYHFQIHPLELSDWPVDSFDDWQVGVVVEKLDPLGPIPYET